MVGDARGDHPQGQQGLDARGRRLGLLAGAAAIGLANGWIARSTRSLVAVSAAHAVTDASGVRQARETWLAG